MRGAAAAVRRMGAAAGSSNGMSRTAMAAVGASAQGYACSHGCIGCAAGFGWAPQAVVSSGAAVPPPMHADGATDAGEIDEHDGTREHKRASGAGAFNEASPAMADSGAAAPLPADTGDTMDADGMGVHGGALGASSMAEDETMGDTSDGATVGEKRGRGDERAGGAPKTGRNSAAGKKKSKNKYARST